MDADFADFVLGALLNMLVAVVIVRFIYYPLTQSKSYVFAFLVFNTVLYFVMSVLSSIQLSIGVGFGLFAIFTVLRYRTEEIPIREITYLFAIMALPLLNASLSVFDDVAELLVVNVTTIAVLFVLEREWGFHFEASKVLVYDRIDLITPENHHLLLADIRERTGLPVKRVDIGRINFLRDVADIQVHYDVPGRSVADDHQQREFALRGNEFLARGRSTSREEDDTGI